jgi:hypothetical protein
MSIIYLLQDERISMHASMSGILDNYIFLSIAISTSSARAGGRQSIVQMPRRGAQQMASGLYGCEFFAVRAYHSETC